MKTGIRWVLYSCVFLAALSQVSANCNPSKLYSTWDFTDSVYYYVYFGEGSMENTDYTVGAFWEPGNRSLANEGSCDDSSWLRYYEPHGPWYVSGEWGSACAFGCAEGGMVLVITDDKGSGADFAVGRADETPAKAAHFNFADFHMTPLPKPRATSITWDLVNCYVDLDFDDLAAGFNSRFGHEETSVITGINLYAAPDEDRGRLASDWTFHSTAPYAGGTTHVDQIVLDRTVSVDWYLVGGLQLDGGDYDTVHVSASLHVFCDNILADPDDKFDIIKTKGKGKKKGKPFRE